MMHKTLQLLTCFELYTRKLHKKELLLSLILAVQLHHLFVFFLLPIEVKLLVHETLPDLLHLLPVPLFLAHPFQNGQSLGQIGLTVPCVAVLG